MGILNRFTFFNVLLLLSFGVFAQTPISNLTDTIIKCRLDSVWLKTGGIGAHQWSTGETTDSIYVGMSGLYSVTISNVNGQVEDSSRVINVPKPKLCFQDSILGFTVAYKNHSENCDSYNWNFSNIMSSTAINPIFIFHALLPFWTYMQGSNSCESVDTLVWYSLPDSTGVRLPEISSNVVNWDVNFALAGMSGRIVDSLLWDFGDGTTSMLGYPSHTYSSMNSYECYTVTLRFLEACKWDTITKEIAVGNYPSSNPCNVTTEIEDVNLGADLSIYPNPNDGSFNLEFESKNGGEVEISIISLSGEILMRKTVYSNLGVNKEIVDLNDFSSGLYLVQIQSDEIKIVGSVTVF